MADAHDRALAALITILTPAAALGIRCPRCGRWEGSACFDTEHGAVPPHDERQGAAEDALRRALSVLLDR